jgi:hypothetical protein
MMSQPGHHSQQVHSRTTLTSTIPRRHLHLMTDTICHKCYHIWESENWLLQHSIHQLITVFYHRSVCLRMVTLSFHNPLPDSTQSQEERLLEVCSLKSAE